MYIKKFTIGILIASLLVGFVPSVEAKASTNTISETESNDTAQTANAITINSGTTVISGSTCYRNAGNYVKDEYDWFKITFAEQGRCDFKGVNLTTPSRDLLSNDFEVYDEDFEKCGSWKYGLAHDAGDTFYLRVKYDVFGGDYDNGYYYEYQITLSEDNSVEYVGSNHTSTASAYLLTKGVAAFTLGWGDSYPRYFAVTVPAGKKATIYFEPDADADMNAIISSPFKVSIIRKSDGTKLLSNSTLKTSTSCSYVTYSDKKVYLSGKDTYYVAISGGSSYSPNCQWISVKYTLDNYKIDTTKPTITGVKNGKTYKKAVTIKFSDASGIKSAKLNGKKVKSGVKVSKNGSYTISVTDKAGNTRTVRFKIKKK